LFIAVLRSLATAAGSAAVLALIAGTVAGHEAATFGATGGVGGDGGEGEFLLGLGFGDGEFRGFAGFACCVFGA